MEPRKLDQTNATCRVYTFKEGLLSAVGHDLELDVGSFVVMVEASGSVAGTFDLRSLRVKGAVHDGITTSCTPSDCARIEQSMKDDVLKVEKYGTASLRGTRTGDIFEGTLTLHGVARPLRATSTHAEEARVEVTLRPSEFGIKPYRAMLGTLRVEDRVRVEIRWKLDALQ